MAVLNLTVGRAHCGRIRDFLKRCKFKGVDIEYIESSGWIQRSFTVKGSDDDIVSIHKAYLDWAKATE